MSVQMGLAAPNPDRNLVVHNLRGLLAVFNQAGVLNPADVHTAETVCRIGQESDERVRLALARGIRW